MNLSDNPIDRGRLPAFPLNHGRTNGMTIRECLAGMALQGILAHKSSTINFNTVAQDAVTTADALLAKLSNSSAK